MDDVGNSSQKKKYGDTSFSSSPSSNEKETPSKKPKEKFVDIVKKIIYQIRFNQFDPKKCVQLLRDPTLEVLVSLKTKAEKLDEDWIRRFLNTGGLDALLDLFDTTERQKVTRSEVSKLVECVACIKTLANSKTALSFLVQKDSYIKRLVTALDTNHETVKTQVFKILSALCMYSSEGYHLTLYALESFKIKKNQKYLFSVIVKELKFAELLPYRCALMAFVNCIIKANEKLHERVRIRNELIGLNLLDIINDLQKGDDTDMISQCDDFYKNKDDDTMAILNPTCTCMDFSNVKEVFNAVYHKACSTSLEEVLLDVMKIFLQTEKPLSNEQWELLKTSLRSAFLGDTSEKDVSSGPPKTPPPPLTHASLRPPPTPLPPPPPPPPPLSSPNTGGFSNICSHNPKQKMRTINWTKIPHHHISSDENLWKKVNSMEDQIRVKYETLEKLFCRKTIDKSCGNKPQAEIHSLLESNRDLAVNVVLKQFEFSHSEIVSMIESCEVKPIGIERLRRLQAILPKKEEISLLEDFDGDKDKLGNAEKFFLELITIPGFRTCIEGLVFREEFDVTSLFSYTNATTRVLQQFMEDNSLKVFLRYVLHTGNFINAGGYAGDALGFEIYFLNELMDIRTNDPNVTLLHYLVEETVKEDKGALAFVENMFPDLVTASERKMAEVNEEITQLKDRVTELKKNLENCPNEVQNQLGKFVQAAEEKMESLDGDLKNIADLKKRLIYYLCENEESFKLDECIDNMKKFCDSVNKVKWRIKKDKKK